MPNSTRFMTNLSNDNWPAFERTWANWGKFFPAIAEEELPRECRWSPTPARDSEADFRRAEKPFRAEIESVVTAPRANEPLDKISVGARYFLHVRFDVVHDFLHTLYVPHWHEPDVGWTKIPFPNLEGDDLFRFLMLNWWNAHGANRAVSLRLEADLSGDRLTW